MKRLGKAKARLSMLGALACSLPLIGFALTSSGASAAAAAGAVKVVDVSGISLAGVSCNSETLCVAVGSKSDEAAVLRIPNGTPGRTEIVSAAGSDSAFSAISCPDSTNCLAVGRGPTRSPEGPTTTAGIIVRITSGTPGSVSHVLGTGLLGSPDEDYLYGVGCTHASECMVAGSDTYLGGILFPVQSGGAGTLQSVDNYIMFGVSCFEKDYCIATGSAVNPYPPPPQYGLAIGEKIGQSSGEAQWGGSNIDSLDGTGCHSDNSDSCVAVGNTTKGKGAILPIVKLTGGNTETVLGATGLNAVACEGSTYCVAVGQNSGGEGVLVGTTGNKQGVTVPVPGTTQLLAVGCTYNMKCIAVGSDSAKAVLVEFSLPL